MNGPSEHWIAARAVAPNLGCAGAYGVWFRCQHACINAGTRHDHKIGTVFQTLMCTQSWGVLIYIADATETIEKRCSNSI